MAAESSIAKLHKEVDKSLQEALSMYEGFGLELPAEGLRYFAADIVAEHYSGRYLHGLAAACQCFLYSRLLHGYSEKVTAERVLLGDYFTGQVAGFELPENSPEILEILSDFVIEEAASGAAYKEKPKLKSYEALFKRIAEVADE